MFLKALKAACLRLRNVKAHLQEAKMVELVAATGMWKYRCDNLKRDVMEQVKGMGDKMDWDTYYPDSRTPLDDVEVEAHTERTGSGLLFNYVADNPPLVERSTIEIISRPSTCSMLVSINRKRYVRWWTFLRRHPRLKVWKNWEGVIYCICQS